MQLSYSQDAIGPFARNVKDLAIALTVMASVGNDPNDNTTAAIPPSSMGVDYSTAISGGTLKGLRFGLLEGLVNRTASNETTPVNDAIDSFTSVLEAAGATVVSINETVYNAATLGNLDLQTYENQEAMGSYLQSPFLTGEHPSTLAEIWSSGKYLVIPSQYGYVNNSLTRSTSDPAYFNLKSQVQDLITTLNNTLSSNNLDAVLYPEQKNLVVKIGSASQVGRNGILAALTGFPVVTVPAGFSPPTTDAPIGVPIGMEILGAKWSERKLLNIAAHVSELPNIRRAPAFADRAVNVPHYSVVPKITPDTADIPSVYPVGVDK